MREYKHRFSLEGKRNVDRLGKVPGFVVIEFKGF